MMTLAEIALKLDDPEPEARRLATQRITRLGGAEAAELLIRALGDTDWRVRKEAAQVASTLEPRAAVIARLALALHDAVNIGLRNAAVEALRGIGQDALSTTIEHLAKLDADGRKLAVEVLSGIPDPRGARALAATLLNDDDSNVRSAAAEALGHAALAGDEARDLAISALTKCLSSPELFLKLAALDSLTRLEARVPWEVFRPLVNDPVLRRHAVAAAACSREPEAITALAQAAGDSSQTVAREAILALGDCVQFDPRDEAVVDVAREALVMGGTGKVARAKLRKMAASQDGRVEGASSAETRARGAALIVLGLMRDSGDIPLLLEALADDGVAEHAEIGLKLFGGDAVGPLMDAGREATPAVRGASISIVSMLAPAFEENVLEDLREALQSPSPDVLAGTLKTISVVGVAEDLARVSPLVFHADARVAGAASSAVFAIATRQLDAARAMLDGLDGRESQAAIGCMLLDAIVRSGQGTRERDLTFLKSALSHRSLVARRAGLEAMATIGGTAAAEAASFALADDEPDVVVAAVRALGRLGFSEPLEALAARTQDSALVAAALRALADAAPDRCLRAALPLIRGVNAAIACAAVEAVGHVGTGTEADGMREDALFAALDHADGEVVKLALSEVGRARTLGPRALARVVMCLDHQAREVRNLAAELLGQDASTESHAILRARLERERDPGLRAALNSALSARPAGLDT